MLAKGDDANPSWTIKGNGGRSGATEPSSQRKRARACANALAVTSAREERGRGTGATSARAASPNGTRVGHGELVFVRRKRVRHENWPSTCKAALLTILLTVAAPFLPSA